MSRRRLDRQAQRRADSEARNAHTLPERRAAWRKSCPSGKVKYPTEHDAQVALVGTVVRRNGGRPQRRESRLYGCPLCGAFHLTSRERAA